MNKLENLFLLADWDNDFHKKLWNCKFTLEVKILLNEKLTLPKDDELTIQYMCRSLGLRIQSPGSNGNTSLSNTELKELDKCKTTCQCAANTQHCQSNYGIRSFCNTCKLIRQKVDSINKCTGCGKKESKLLCLHCVRCNYVFRNRVSEKLEIKDSEQRLRDKKTFRARENVLEENEQKRHRLVWKYTLVDADFCSFVFYAHNFVYCTHQSTNFYTYHH